MDEAATRMVELEMRSKLLLKTARRVALSTEGMPELHSVELANEQPY